MNKESIKKLIRKKGTIHQSLIAIEELSELQKAITKALRVDDGDDYVASDYKSNLHEEIADVLICIEQLKIIYNLSDEDIEAWKQAKEDRLSERYLETLEENI